MALALTHSFTFLQIGRYKAALMIPARQLLLRLLHLLVDLRPIRPPGHPLPIDEVSLRWTVSSHR